MGGKSVVSAKTMGVGTDKAGRHWTQAEVNARQAATEKLTRKTPGLLRCPTWLTPDARKVWNRVKKQAADFDLLDELDIDMLAIYCDSVAKYQAEGGQSQSLARLIAMYADKLGLTPSARARLAQKRAAEIVDNFGDEFD